MEALEDVPYVAARAALPEHLEQRKKRGSDRMRYIADTTEFQIEEPTIVTWVSLTAGTEATRSY